MRDDDESNWFVKWDEELPSPEELISLSQSLITPNLAMAFDIQNTTTTTTHHLLQQPPPPPPLQDTRNSSGHEFELFESGGTAGGGGGRGSDRGGAGSEEHVKNLKRPRLVWTPQLHKRFVEVVAHLGIKNAVPKTIMQMMSVDGLTRENVASHLQKYRLYLKRMQKGVSNGGSRGFVTDTDHLFASSPVPAHFLHPGRPSSDQFLPSVPVTTMSHHHQMAAAAALGNHQHNHNLRHFGTSTSYGQFNHPFLSTQLQSHVLTPYLKDTGPAKPTTNVQKALTLFPSGND